MLARSRRVMNDPSPKGMCERPMGENLSYTEHDAGAVGRKLVCHEELGRTLTAVVDSDTPPGYRPSLINTGSARFWTQIEEKGQRQPSGTRSQWTQVVSSTKLWLSVTKLMFLNTEIVRMSRVSCGSHRFHRLCFGVDR